MTNDERKEALDLARTMHETDEKNGLADLRGAHAGRAILLAEVDTLTAERDAWKAYAQAQRAIRYAEHDNDAHADFEAKRDLAAASGALRTLGIDPGEA